MYCSIKKKTPTTVEALLCILLVELTVHYFCDALARSVLPPTHFQSFNFRIFTLATFQHTPRQRSFTQNEIIIYIRATHNYIEHHRDCLSRMTQYRCCAIFNLYNQRPLAISIDSLLTPAHRTNKPTH